MLSLVILSLSLLMIIVSAELPDQRPAKDKRTYTSSVIDNVIDELVGLFEDPNIARIFSNCWPNTLDTTVAAYDFTDPSKLDSFIITGDIYALWLRDSQNQVQAYIPYAVNDTNLTNLIEGLIQRQANSIILDSFANAFNYNASGEGHQNDQRKPPMKPYIFEGKYELDSLMSFLKLSYWHYRYSGDKALKQFVNKDWLTAVASVLKTVNTMQIDDGQTENPPYTFERLADSALETLPLSGRGFPVQPFGLSRQLFRPSDDAVTHGYNLPGNMMACVELKHLSELLQVIGGEQKLKSDADKIGSEICGAIAEVLKISQKLDTVIPYEVDGYGGSIFMDDANVPSLLSIPILGFMSNSHNIYKKTRDRVFSLSNPYFYKGISGFGIGGPHEGRNYAWPMSLIVAAMTSNNDEEITELLNILKTTTANTGLMHEAFNVKDSFDFTRSWFAWANGLFGELILQLIVTKPKLLLKDDPDIIKKAQALVKIPVSLQVQLDLDQ